MTSQLFPMILFGIATAFSPGPNNIIKSVHPIMTPNIVGIAFLTPKLNAVYDVMILLGPGEKAVAIPKRIMGNN